MVGGTDFLFRAIKVPADVKGTAFALNDLELASRLSFFLWSQGPDDTLLDIAAAGKLRTPDALQTQALRMLRDRRALSLVRNFALKWLDLDNLDEVVADPNLFPAFDDGLRRDLATEMWVPFVSSILLEDRNVGDLLTADHTFLNQRLARHYGLTSVLGSQFRRVTLEDSRRWGVLGKGAVTLGTWSGDRTSPVLRGAWIIDKLMGTPPTPPPPDVKTDLSNPKGEPPKTLRARLESHRSKPGCNRCHGVIDPIGLAMENFDAIGRWRDQDLGGRAPIDTKTVLPNRPPRWTRARCNCMRRASTAGTCSARLHRKADDVCRGAGVEGLRHDPGPCCGPPRRGAGLLRLSSIVAGVVASDACRMQALPPAKRD